MKRNPLLIVGAVITAGILAFSLLATSALSPAAVADRAKVLTMQTIPLEGLSLNEGEFLLLADTTPAEIESGHVALSIPCEDNGDTPETSIDVVAGVAPDLGAVDLEYVGDLSSPEDNRCTFHVTIPENDEAITDVAIINSENETVAFESGHFAAISLTTARGYDDDEDKDDEEDTDDQDDQNERTFRADLTGDKEVPAVDTNASGDIALELDVDETELEYQLNVEDIVDVVAAHIHMGAEGENGDIVVTLEHDDEMSEGTITEDDLEGSLDGGELSDLIELIEDDNAYVNVHTEENPDGEIRGQLEEE